MNKKIKLLDIVNFLNVENDFEIKDNFLIKGIASLNNATSDDLSFFVKDKITKDLETTKAKVVLVNSDFNDLIVGIVLIKVKNPSLDINEVVKKFFLDPSESNGKISDKCFIDETACIGKNVSIGNFVVIEKNVKIGDNTIIKSGSFIGEGTEMGKDVLIHPNVTILANITIGDRVVIFSGTVIGSDGFGFLPGSSGLKKIFQLGNVIIEDDVEIQSNTVIDRARFDDTLIKKGTKIDNLVHIAHNVEIGENSMILAQVGIAGSATLGNNVILAGQSGVVGHIKLEDNVILGSKSAVSKNIKKGSIVSGIPAVDHVKFRKNVALINRLPKLVDRITALEFIIKDLKKQFDKD